MPRHNTKYPTKRSNLEDAYQRKSSKHTSLAKEAITNINFFVEDDAILNSR
jgi:hypothetical protein